MTLPKIGFSTVIKLLLASFAVGILLAYFDIKPEDILAKAQSWVSEITGDVSAYASTALTFVLLGAVIVVPIWFLNYLWRAVRDKS